MAFFYFLLSFLLLILIKTEEKTFSVPSTLIVITWGVFPGIASLQPLGLNELDDYTHFVILLALFSFLIAYYSLIHHSSSRYNTSVTPKVVSSQEVNYVFLLILNVIACVYLFPKTIVSWATIQAVGWDQVRFYSDELFGSTGDNTIYQVFARPLFVASLSLISVDIFRSFKLTFTKSLFILFVLINVAQESIIFAARATLIKIVLFLIFSFFFLNSNPMGTRNSKGKWKLALMLFIMYNVIAYITKGRNANLDENSSILGTFIAYYIAPFSLLDYYITHPDFAQLGVENLTFGGCIIGCIYNFFCMTATFLFKVPYWGTDYIVTEITSQQVYVAHSWQLNAACTAAYPFMKDFGVLGVIIGFIFCAFICVKIKWRYNNTPTLRNGAIYIFILYTIFRLSVQYDFLFPSSIASIAYIYFGTRATKIQPLNKV